MLEPPRPSAEAPCTPCFPCYTIRGADNVLAVVIETKMDQSSQDALAHILYLNT